MNPWRGMGDLPRAVWILAAASLINRARTMALPFLVLYLTKARSFTPGSAGFALVVYGLGALLVAPLAGRLSDRIGALGVMKGSLFLSGATLVAYPFVRGYWLIIAIEVPLNNAMSHWSHRRSLALGAALCGLGFGALALASGFVSAAATVVIWTFGEMITLPASAAFIADIAPPGRRGSYMGFYTMSFSLAFIAGPWLGIKVLEVWGGTTLWVAVLCCGLLSSFLLTRISPAREAQAASD